MADEVATPAKKKGGDNAEQDFDLNGRVKSMYEKGASYAEISEKFHISDEEVREILGDSDLLEADSNRTAGHMGDVVDERPA